MNELAEQPPAAIDTLAQREPGSAAGATLPSDEHVDGLASSLRRAPSEGLVRRILAAAERARRDSPAEQWKAHAARLLTPWPWW